MALLSEATSSDHKNESHSPDHECLTRADVDDILKPAERMIPSLSFLENYANCIDDHLLQRLNKAQRSC